MEQKPARKPGFANTVMAIVLVPFAIAFFIAAALAAGPREAFKGIFGRSDGKKRED